MVEVGQLWGSGERSVLVLAVGVSHVVVRDSYGWRRSLSRHDLERGFRVVGDCTQVVPGVMGCRALADVQPA